MTGDKFHSIEIAEPDDGRTLGCVMWIDGMRIKGLADYHYDVQLNQPKILTLVIHVNDVTIRPYTYKAGEVVKPLNEPNG